MTDSAIRNDLLADPRLEQLIVATSALITELSLDGVLQRVVRVAAEVIGAHYAAIGVLAPDGRVLESFTTFGISDEDRERIGPLPRGHGILGLVIREARPSGCRISPGIPTPTAFRPITHRCGPSWACPSWVAAGCLGTCT